MRGTGDTDSIEGFEKITKIILENTPKNAFFKWRNPAGKRGGGKGEKVALPNPPPPRVGSDLGGGLSDPYHQ